MKKNKRIGALVDELINNPCRLYDSKHFCDKFDIAKSSLSEDIRTVNELLQENGSGHIESISGVGGGIKFIPGIPDGQIRELQESIIGKLTDTTRLLGGGYFYTSDIMFDGHAVRDMARVFAQQFYGLGADYVVTVETKGIALAQQVAFLMNLPMVVIRREAKYSEGSTVSINYFSGTYEKIQRMSLSKRAVKSGARAIIIDDFMRGGGSLKGIQEILGEFEVEAVGVGVALASVEPVKKKVEDYVPLIWVHQIDEEENIIDLRPNENLRCSLDDR